MSWLKMLAAARRWAGVAGREGVHTKQVETPSKLNALRVFKLLVCSAPAAVMGHVALEEMAQRHCHMDCHGTDDSDVTAAPQPVGAQGEDEHNQESEIPALPPINALEVVSEAVGAPQPKEEKNSFKEFLEAADLSSIKCIEAPVIGNSRQMAETQADSADINCLASLVQNATQRQELTSLAHHNMAHSDMAQTLGDTAEVFKGLMQDACTGALDSVGALVKL